MKKVSPFQEEKATTYGMITCMTIPVVVKMLGCLSLGMEIFSNKDFLDLLQIFIYDLISYPN
jgi:hypothetical protein